MTVARDDDEKRRLAEAYLAEDRPENVLLGEIVQAQARASAPISVRLSAPLLEAIDRLAEQEHRKRGNMIQHILWDYVHRHDSGANDSARKKRAF